MTRTTAILCGVGLVAVLGLTACVGDTVTRRGGTAKMTVPGQPNVYVFRHQTPRTTVLVSIDTVDGPDARTNMGSMADKRGMAEEAALHYTSLRVCTNGAPVLDDELTAIYSLQRNNWVVPVSCATDPNPA